MTSHASRSAKFTARQPSEDGAAARAGLYAGFVINGIVTNGGEGYTSVPAVQFTGGGGTNAGGAARLSNGRVASVQITNAGLGYLTPPQILIDPPNGLLIGQTNPVLNLNAVGSALVGGYYVVISSAVDSVTSRVATLGLALSPQIVRQPQNQLVPFGAALLAPAAQPTSCYGTCYDFVEWIPTRTSKFSRWAARLQC